MYISSLAFVWTHLQIQHYLEEATLAQNWNEMLKVGWARNFLILKTYIGGIDFSKINLSQYCSVHNWDFL